MYVNSGTIWVNYLYNFSKSLTKSKLILGEYWFPSANAQSGYQCEECFKVFANRNSYTNHLPSHQGKTTCTHCGKEFSSPSNLNKHIRRNHMPTV